MEETFVKAGGVNGGSLDGLGGGDLVRLDNVVGLAA